MPSRLVNIILASDPDVRDQSLDAVARQLSTADLLAECDALETLRRTADNLYHRVRSLFFLAAIHRFHLPTRKDVPASGSIPFAGYQHLLERRFDEAIDSFLHVQKTAGPSDPISSALAAGYKELAFQTLANQVRRSVRSVRGNQWMFRIGHPADHPLRLRPELLERSKLDGSFPILSEKTPVRMDLTHSGWSDIFFLGMDFPEGARVLNISVDLAVHGRDPAPRPPVEAYLRVIDQPVLRLVSVDLGARADITNLNDVFDFAKDYLGLLKAAIIAAGIIPPGVEGSGQSLQDLLARVVGPGLGLEVVSIVNNIPKGSRLAVSTNLLGSLISVCMRATGQARSLTGELEESERRLVMARAILGEWIGGSGGGWQDSGGVWPGMKVISGAIAAEGDPEFGISRGRLQPTHRILSSDDCSPEVRQKLQDSLVVVHGGMAQNVGPILEMVTEKYLLRSEREWAARKDAIGILDQILGHLKSGDIAGVGASTTRNFFEPIQAIIPWASNLYTERLIAQSRDKFTNQFLGFWMLGGMSGGGMGFIFDPKIKAEAQVFLQETMSATKKQLQHSLPFAMEPVVFDYAINPHGTFARLLKDDDALLPPAYYAMIAPMLVRADPRTLSPQSRAELDRFAEACRRKPELAGMVQTLFDRLLPRPQKQDARGRTLDVLLGELGFDRVQHEKIREELRSGRIGLSQNRLPVSTSIEDVHPGDVIDATGADEAARQRGIESLKRGEVGVLSLAAGVGSRWTQGAGVVKALHPFCKLSGTHRTFLEVHLAKSRRIGSLVGTPPPHLVTTSHLTHEPIEQFLHDAKNYGYPGTVMLSPGATIGLRMVPTERDLRFHWEETPQKLLDEQKQKMLESVHAALIGWAKSVGEASDYTDNLPAQCLHPVGHFFEVPNLLRNGVLQRLLAQHPNLKYLMLHNIDTVGADLDPTIVGHVIARNAAVSFEVITRRLEDRGGGLARVNGRLRLVEGLAMPDERAEFGLSYYNTLTSWIDIDKLLAVMGLSRSELADQDKVNAATRALAARLPTYVTLKDVKKRWGHGQEDVFPVAQFEKLWGDITALPEVDTAFLAVPRLRGQQLKDQAQLDGWLRDGSARFVESIASF